MTRLKPILAVLALGVLAACAGHSDLETEPEPIGDFRLGHNIVVTDRLQKGPLSREATPEEWEEILVAEIDRRLGRYDGDGMYHIAVNLDAYVLAVPGVPVVANPRSLLIMRVTVWDDAAQAKINETPEQLTIMEDVSGATVISSGLTQSREAQMENLARNAARAIQRWLERNEEWFEPAADVQRDPDDPETDPETDPEAAPDPDAEVDPEQEPLENGAGQTAAAHSAPKPRPDATDA